MNITLHIERLILDGVEIAPYQRAMLQVAIQSELTRLLSEGGLASDLTAGGAVPSVPAHAIQMTAKNDPVQLGQQIARSVYGGIRR